MIKQLVILFSLMAALVVSGCVNAPVKETAQAKDRYVQINLLDGTSVGGKYISETAAFTTITVMYTLNPDAYKWDANRNYVKDPDKYIVKGNGAEVSIKSSLINTMVTIDDPMSVINATQKELRDEAAALQKAADEKADQYRIEAEKRDAEIAKRMPTKPKVIKSDA